MDINIPEIGIRELNIHEIPKWLTDASLSLPHAPPVTINIGIPIVDMPGCVEAHDTNNYKNNKIVDDDPKGVKTFCDAGIPSYNPIEFNPEVELGTSEAPVPPYKAPDTKPLGGLPKDLPNPVTAQINKEETVEEIPPPEPKIPWQEKYLPAPEAVTTTASIAVVATTSALLAKPLADLLLKVVKPTVKKVMTKIAKIRGKEVKILSLMERRDLQRERSHAIRVLRRTLNPKG